MTIGCISDPHCEFGLLSPKSGNVDDVKLRGTFVQTLKKMKAEENIDVLLLGGDYTGLDDAKEENWLRSRELIVDATRAVFNNGKAPYVLYANGNHEYQVAGSIPKSYNSGDYYSFPMMSDVGTLSSDDCYYEEANNGKNGKVSLLAAYHYELKGVDFVVINTGKYLYENQDHYYYSDESANWCINKVKELYEKNPTGTVFFVMHIPFADSNSIRSSSKGQSTTATNASKILKEGLAEYPNTIVLYGHDHGGDNAYTREKTSQRLTRYDANGNKMSGYGLDATHVDGLVRGEEETATDDEPTTPTQPAATFTSGTINLKNLDNNLYLGCTGDKNIDLVSSPQDIEVGLRDAGNSLFYVHMLYNGTKYNLSAGSGFSAKDRTSSTSEQENSYFYCVDDINATTITATKASALEIGKYYVITNTYQNNIYVLSGNLQSKAGSDKTNRISNGSATINGNTLTMNNANGAARTYIYKMEGEVETTPTAGGSTTQSSSVDGSFVTLFMGSMRYYDNIFEGKWDTSNDTVSAKVAQALMIYVYNDRIEMRLKNYGKSGTFTGGKGFEGQSVTINEELTPYTIFRTVTLASQQEPDGPVVPTPKIYAQTAVGGDWNLVEAEDGVLTIDDYHWKGFKSETDYDFDAINYSRLYKSNMWQAWYVPFDLELTSDILNNFAFARIQGAMADIDGATYIAYVRLREGDIVKANTPYVVKAAKADATNAQVITANNATLKMPVQNSFTMSSALDVYEFCGIYNARVATATDWDQWYAINNSGVYQHMSEGVTLQPFRIYMTITPRDDSPYSVEPQPQSVKLVVYGDEDSYDEDATAIRNAVLKAQKMDKWYNLQGIEVQTPTKGIYIKNGKKYLF